MRWVGLDLSGVAKDNQQTISLDVLLDTKGSSDCLSLGLKNRQMTATEPLSPIFARPRPRQPLEHHVEHVWRFVSILQASHAGAHHA